MQNIVSGFSGVVNVSSSSCRLEGYGVILVLSGLKIRSTRRRALNIHSTRRRSIKIRVTE